MNREPRDLAKIDYNEYYNLNYKHGDFYVKRDREILEDRILILEKRVKLLEEKSNG